VPVPTLTSGGLPVSPPVNIRHVFHDPPTSSSDPIEPMSGGYHQWFVGQWNGTSNPVLNPAQIDFSNGDAKSHVFTPATQGPVGLPLHLGPTWLSTGVDLYVTPGEVKPSRVGKNVGDLLTRLNGGALRRSSTNTSASGVSFLLSTSTGSSSGGGTLDLLDLNGDGLPDSIDNQFIRILSVTPGAAAAPQSPLDISLSGDAILRDISSDYARFGFSFGSSAAALASVAGASGTVKSLTTLLPSFGLAFGHSHTVTDFVDINGDGLPDRVRRDGSGSTTVRLIWEANLAAKSHGFCLMAGMRRLARRDHSMRHLPTMTSSSGPMTTRRIACRSGMPA
jgi:hypothetical protein